MILKRKILRETLGFFNIYYTDHRQPHTTNNKERMRPNTKSGLFIILMGIFSILLSWPLLAQGPVSPNSTVINVSKTNPYQEEKFEVQWMLSNPPGQYDCIGVFPTSAPEQVVWRVATHDWIYARTGSKTTFQINEAGLFEIRYMVFDTTTRNTYNTRARSPLITVLPLPSGNESIVIVSRTNINVGDSVQATWIGTRLSTTSHYVGIYKTNVPLSHTGWQAIKYVNAVRWFKDQVADFFFEESGTFEIRLVAWNDRAQTTETLAVSEKITVEELIPDPRDIRNFGRAGNGPIIAFGDSITAGIGYGASSSNRTFPAALSRWLYNPTPIINMGKGAETTAAALARLPSVLSQNPKIVIVGHAGYDFLQRIPTPTTFRNLRTMIDQIHAQGAMVILLGIQGGGYFDNGVNYRELVIQTSCAYVPNVLRGILGNLEKTSDPVHPNDWGYDIIAERIAPFIVTLTSSTGPGPNHGPGPTLIITRGNGTISLSADLGPEPHTLLWSNGVTDAWFPVLRDIRGNNLTFEVPTEGPQLFFQLVPEGPR